MNLWREAGWEKAANWGARRPLQREMYREGNDLSDAGAQLPSRPLTQAWA